MSGYQNYGPPDDGRDADGYDWSNGQQAGEPRVAAEDFVIGGYAVPEDRDAQAIREEAEGRDFRYPPAGDHVLFIKGFKDAPRREAKKVFLPDGRAVSYETHTVAVRLAMTDDPGATILDYFTLPPVERADDHAYNNGATQPNGTYIHANKFITFLEAMGWDVPRGQAPPVEALALRNWLGRRVRCTIQKEGEKKGEAPRINPKTGEPYPPRMQVKLFSYSNPDAPSLLGGQARGPVAPTARPVAPPVPQQIHNNPAVARGNGPPAPAPSPGPAAVSPAARPAPAQPPSPRPLHL